MGVFIVKYNTQGVVQWTARVDRVTSGGKLACSASSIFVTAIAPTTTAITVYHANDTLAFTRSRFSTNDADTLVWIRYDSGGSALSAAQVESAGGIVSGSIIADSAENVILIGHYRYPTDECVS